MNYKILLVTIFLILAVSLVIGQSLTGSNRAGDLVCDDVSEVLIAKTKLVFKNGQHVQTITHECVCKPGFKKNLQTKNCDPLSRL